MVMLAASGVGQYTSLSINYRILTRAWAKALIMSFTSVALYFRIVLTYLNGCCKCWDMADLCYLAPI